MKLRRGLGRVLKDELNTGFKSGRLGRLVKISGTVSLSGRLTSDWRQKANCSSIVRVCKSRHFPPTFLLVYTFVSTAIFQISIINTSCESSLVKTVQFPCSDTNTNQRKTWISQPALVQESMKQFGEFRYLITNYCRGVVPTDKVRKTRAIWITAYRIRYRIYILP